MVWQDGKFQTASKLAWHFSLLVSELGLWSHGRSDGQEQHAWCVLQFMATPQFSLHQQRCFETRQVGSAQD